MAGSYLLIAVIMYTLLIRSGRPRNLRFYSCLLPTFILHANNIVYIYHNVRTWPEPSTQMTCLSEMPDGPDLKPITSKCKMLHLALGLVANQSKPF